jgi:hypothetical protein
MTKVRFYNLCVAGPVSLATNGQTLAPPMTFDNASSYLTFQPGHYSFTLTFLNSHTQMSLPVTLQANTVTSVFGVGQAGSSGATALRLVTIAVPGIPTAMPGTGFAPHPQLVSGGVNLALDVLLAALALALLGGAGIALARQRIRL